MANVYFRARLLWHSGERRTGFELLASYLAERLGRPVLVAEERLFQPHSYREFEGALYSGLRDLRVLQVPLESVLPLLWLLYRHEIWLDALIETDLFSSYPFDLLGDEVSAEIRNNVDSDLLRLAELLEDDGRKGRLAPRDEGLNGGRPALPVEKVENVPDDYWGAFKQTLISGLSSAYAECPPDFWERLANAEPKDTALNFLHDLFLRAPVLGGTLEGRWAAIRRDNQPYADAAMKALHTLIRAEHEDELREIVHYDAGLPSIAEGRSWLESLYDALDQQTFSMLEYPTS